MSYRLNWLGKQRVYGLRLSQAFAHIFDRPFTLALAAASTYGIGRVFVEYFERAEHLNVRSRACMYAHKYDVDGHTPVEAGTGQ